MPPRAPGLGAAGGHSPPPLLLQGKQKDGPAFAEYGGWYKACKVDRYVCFSVNNKLWLTHTKAPPPGDTRLTATLCSHAALSKGSCHTAGERPRGHGKAAVQHRPAALQERHSQTPIGASHLDPKPRPPLHAALASVSAEGSVSAPHQAGRPASSRSPGCSLTPP